MRMTAWNVFLTIGISAAPIIELRGGIPFALSQGLSPAVAFALALLGNLAVIPVLLWGFQWMEAFFMRWRVTRNIMEWVFARSRRKGRWIER
ncbi:small multi-drug export protein, partial [Candidatus Bipolaricaulota bacterium]